MGNSLSSVSFSNQHLSRLSGLAGDVGGKRIRPGDYTRRSAELLSQRDTTAVEAIQLKGSFFENDEVEQLRGLQGQRVVMHVSKADPNGVYPIGQYVGNLKLFSSSRDHRMARIGIDEMGSVQTNNITATISPVYLRD